MTIQDRIGGLVDVLRDRRRCRFDELFEGVTTSYDLVVTFLALLELLRESLIEVVQADEFAPLHVRAASTVRLVTDDDTPPAADSSQS